MPSAVDSLSKAFGRSGKICFKPFNFGAWAAMALMAFLSGYGSGGFNFNNNFTGGSRVSGSGGHSPIEQWNEFKTWLLSNLPTILIVSGIILFVSLLILVIFTWLGCRAKFVFMDNIVKKHGKIVQPWSEYKLQARSRLIYLMIFGPIFLIGYSLVLFAGFLMALPDFKAEHLTSRGIWAIVFTVFGLLLMALIHTAISITVNNILLPIMYFHKIRMFEAFRIFRTKVLPGNIGQILLFVLLKVVTGMGIALAANLIGCCTCCIGFLPYVGTFLTLPAHVFSQAYDLYFVASFFNEEFFIDETMGFPIENIRPVVADNPIQPPPIPPQV